MKEADSFIWKRKEDQIVNTLNVQAGLQSRRFVNPLPVIWIILICIIAKKYGLSDNASTKGIIRDTI